MSKVLASLKPYYYYLVSEGIKTIEVRKSIPQSDKWDFGVYFYMSKDEKSFAQIPKELQAKYRKHFGKVGLKFVCDEIGAYSIYACNFNYGFIKKTCIKSNELLAYKGKNDYIYGWHITDLNVYDRPKELTEFKKPCENGYDCDRCRRYSPHVTCNGELTRPPQSWFYVEELK